MKLYSLFKAAILFAAIFNIDTTNAQMVGSSIFLKGRFVEVGIGHLGYYGSDTSAPVSYHPHCPGCSTVNSIGFVADIGMDGWTTGSPAYMGDYFTPGTPFEGWVLEVDGHRTSGYNTDSSTSLLTTTGPAGWGNNIAYSTSGSKVRGIWQGNFDSVDITQITTLDTNQLYFTVKVILQNLAHAPKNNIYYLRSLDPDNDVTWPGGGHPTHNVIEFQSTDTTIVSATGDAYPSAYMALGTTDTAATALIYRTWPISIAASMDSAYAGFVAGGSYTGPIGADYFSDIAIGIVMNIPHLATVDSAGDSVYRTTAGAAYLRPANQATINYFYAFSPAARDAAIAYINDTTTGSAGTLAIRNVNTEANIKVYPNPSGEMVNITGLTSTDHVLVYDLMGRDMKQNWNVGRDGTNIFRYDNLPSGAYLLVVTDASGDVKARIPVRKM